MQTKIGVAAVLDPHNMKEGQKFSLNGHLAVVDKIIDDKVFLRLATKKEEFSYFLDTHRYRLTVSICILTAVLVMLYVYYLQGK